VAHTAGMVEVAVATEDLCRLGEKFCLSLYGQPINPQNQSTNHSIDQSINQYQSID